MRRLQRVLAGMVLATLLVAPSAVEPADAVTAVAGKCELVRLELTKSGGVYEVTTASGGTCVFAGLFTGFADTGRIDVTGVAERVFCANGAVRGFSGVAEVALLGDGGAIDRYANVSIDLDGLPGPQPFNPTAAFVLRGLEVGGTGTFTRSGQGDCNGTTTWSMGSIALEDPSL